jgi:hypothetical protein
MASALSVCGAGRPVVDELGAELRMSVMSDFELLDALEELARTLWDDDNPVARLAALVAEDRDVAPFVALVAADGGTGQRFRIIEKAGRLTWGFGEVVFASETGYVVNFTWVRPNPMVPITKQTCDIVDTVWREILFRLAYFNGLRDAAGAPVVAKPVKAERRV